MNRLAQSLHYTGKVFALKTLLRGVRSDRPFARIPTVPVLLSLVLGVVLRVSSYLELSQQTRRRRWQHLCGLQGPLSDDTLEYVTERLSLEDLRQSLASINQRLKANKALESCKMGGLLFVSLDANEHFKSRSRCCECCCQRPIEETDEHGQKHKVTEYYHRCVFAQINGPKFNPLLDLEPIRPGEEECRAALRLQVRAGTKRRESQQSQWLWGASSGLDGYGPRLIYQAGHRRWGIENKAFNELTQGYHLEHCYHHEPVSMLAQMLILLLGFTLFTAFAQLHNKLVRLGELSAKALTRELNLALEQDLPWEQWFHSG